MSDLPIANGVVLPAEELEWRAVRSSGPGGQNVNKVSTKVELRFDLAQSVALSAAVKARLRAQVGGRLDADGKLVLTSDETRSQSRNLELLRERLSELVRAALVPPKRRRPTRPSRASKERRLAGKRQVGEKKRGRRSGWD